MTDLVECHSEHTYAQRPVALHWQGQRQEIDQVESEWRGPSGTHFRVRTVAGDRFELHYDQYKDEWSIQPAG